MNLQLLLLQIAGNVLLAVGAFCWLEIPDSHAWQFCVSVVVALLLAGCFLALVVEVIRRARRAVDPRPRVPAAMIVLVGIVVALLWIAFVGRWNVGVDLRAGYWNSQLGPHMRATFTYERLVQMQRLAIVTLQWLVPLALLPVIVAGVARDPVGVAVRVWGRWQFWLVAIVTLIAGPLATSALVEWHPSSTVHGEVISVVARLTLAYAVDLLLLSFTLVMICELLARIVLREHVSRNAISQPAANSIDSVPGN